MFNLDSSCFFISLPFSNANFEYCFEGDLDVSLSFYDLMELDRSLRGVLYAFFAKKISNS